MAHLIDKDALVAEIERRKNEEVDYDENGGYASWADHNHFYTLDSIQDFVNALEVKEVDLEKELEDWLGERVGKWTGKECERMCRYFFELGLKAQKGE
jgi:hypothetical protein